MVEPSDHSTDFPSADHDRYSPSSRESRFTGTTESPVPRMLILTTSFPTRGMPTMTCLFCRLTNACLPAVGRHADLGGARRILAGARPGDPDDLTTVEAVEADRRQSP